MSENRFTWDGDILFDSLELRELGNCLEARDIVDLLNKLYEENEQLRQSIKELQRSREYWIQDNNRLTKRYNELIAKIDYLENHE